MKRLILAALLASPALADGPARPSTDPNPVVTVEGDTLTYIGGINANGLTALEAALKGLPRDRITKMVVNSGGGDTNPGIFIGSIISDLSPDLTIATGCFSSCANFIAPAARSITIRDGAFLGWHGNDRGMQIVADQKGVSLRDHLATMVADQVKAADLGAYLDEAVPAVEALIAKEQALYARIGLQNDTFAVCGVGARFDDQISGEQRGWGFSIDDMARLGLPPVRFEGKGAYEDSAAFKKWLIQLTPEDCRP
jgi:hypothetical protein